MKRSNIPLYTTVAVLVFFYLPIAVLILHSFNASRFSGAWEGFSLRWYIRLFQEPDIWHAFRNTMVVALIATTASVTLGVAAAFALHRYHTRLQRIHYIMIYTPLVVPDILMGMSLLLFFVAIGAKLGLGTIVLAHTSFCVSYVAMVVLARLQDFDFSVMEAAQDLGAGWWTATVKILLPMLAPGIAAGALLAFTLSIDDFVITFFVTGPGATTLPIQIYSMIKHGSPPLINALSTILIMVTFVLVWSVQKLMEDKHA